VIPFIASKIATWTIAIALEAFGGAVEVFLTAASNNLLQSVTTSSVVLVVGSFVVGLSVVGTLVGI
jgi:hypothetical protein